MKSKLLKLLIVLAAFGIIVVVVVFVFNNKDVEKKTYSVLRAKSDEVNFNTVYQNCNDVKKSYEGESDEYAVAVAEMLAELEKACNYYILYVPTITAFTQDEKDDLVGKYDDYIDAVKFANTKYLEYKSAYESTNEDMNEKNNAIAATGTSYVSYLNIAYQKGSLYYNQLKKIVKSYTNINTDSWVAISYDSVLCLSDSLSAYVAQQMNTRSDPDGVVADINSNKTYKNFNALRTYYDSGTVRADEFANEKISAFVKNYNVISDTKTFWLNTNNYIAALKDGSNVKVAAQGLKQFLTDNVPTYMF